MGAVPRDEQALLRRTPERGAVRQRRVEVGVPGVEVGVEVHQCHRSVTAMVCPQQRIGDGVVATKADQPFAAVDQRERLLFDLANGGGDVDGLQMMSPASTTCWLANG